MKAHTQTLGRLREKAGLVYVDGAWVRKESAPRLRLQIARAAAEAEPQMQAVLGKMERKDGE